LCSKECPVFPGLDRTILKNILDILKKKKLIKNIEVKLIIINVVDEIKIVLIKVYQK